MKEMEEGEGRVPRKRKIAEGFSLDRLSIEEMISLRRKGREGENGKVRYPPINWKPLPLVKRERERERVRGEGKESVPLLESERARELERERDLRDF